MGWQPVAQVGWEQERLVAVAGKEVVGHGRSYATSLLCYPIRPSSPKRAPTTTWPPWSTSPPSPRQGRVGQHPHRRPAAWYPGAADPATHRRVLVLGPEKFHGSFAADLPAEEAAFMADSQVPWGVDALGGSITDPAWWTKPSWYLVATEDSPPGRRSGRQGCPVMGIGHGQRRVVEALRQQPPLVRIGPGRTLPPDAAVAQQEPTQALASPGAVGHHVGPGPAQVPDGLLDHGGHADGGELAGAVQPGQPTTVPPVGLDLVARRLGDQRRRDHLTANLQPAQQAGQLIASRAGLIGGSQPMTIWELRQEPANRRLVVGDPVHGRRLLPRAEDRHRDRVAVHVQTKVGETASSSDTGHRPAPSVCGSVHASVDDPRDPRNGAGRSHAD